MRVAILGAGIAGLATAKMLIDQGHDVTVYEKLPNYRAIGLGFVLLPNGVHALKQMGIFSKVLPHAETLQNVYLYNKESKLLKSQSFDESLGIKRSTCIDALVHLLPPNIIKTGYTVQEFKINNEGNITAAVCSNGEQILADVFFAADGANSVARTWVTPEAKVRSSKIHELVSITEAPQHCTHLGSSLHKYIHPQGFQNIGLLPVNDQQIVWYLQYHSERHCLPDSSLESKRQFLHEKTQEWPVFIQEILTQTPLEKVYCWQTKDFDLLPTFHQKNMVLLGDAAHLALPFTSQGTNSALQDAFFWGKHFTTNTKLADVEQLAQQYYLERTTDVARYLQFGRDLEYQFLNPTEAASTDTPIPFAK
ncbi:MAG: FAD-dependent monooxygenase [Bacteroidetes bacterium]|nr:MAG: FAD-dependent monooxygenase [Bacteroidota bacterium]